MKLRKTDPCHVAYDATCAACGDAASVGTDREPLYTIHRDGFGEGPEVPLCAECGADELPDCPTLWAMIAGRLAEETEEKARTSAFAWDRLTERGVKLDFPRPFGPSKKASPYCRSGRRDYCTCDTCF